MCTSWPNLCQRQQDEYINLGKIIKSVKSYSSRKINQLRGQKGSVWQPERYDRIVRDDAEFLEKWQYIRNNPIKAGLAVRPEDYPWLYESSHPPWHRTDLQVGP